MAVLFLYIRLGKIMKRIFAFLLFLIMPTFVDADMVGYSGDKRRYVTDEEKSQFPYNTVVSIAEGTGTFVSEDVILTCRHVVKDIGVGNYVDYSTTDGKKGSGLVYLYPKDETKNNDFAFVVDRNSFSGSLLGVSPISKRSDNLMVIGYDILKPLSDEELKIIKNLYTDLIKQHGKIKSVEEAFDIMLVLESDLKNNYACSSSNQTNCVHCSNDDFYCIFNDSDNMKVREGCKVIDIDTTKGLLHTDCPGSMGMSGSAIIDINTKQIIGIMCRGTVNGIGQNEKASSYGVLPNSYYGRLSMLFGKLKNLK